MSVYVDNARLPFGKMIMCHMIADTEEELHAMARKCGLKREWFQEGTYSLPHYDICLSVRKQVIKNGAIEIGRRELVEKMKERRGRHGRNKRKSF